MASQLNSFLRENKTNTAFHTHVSMTNPIGKFTINSKMEAFWRIYCSTIKQSVPSVAENPLDETPVFVDVDLSTKYTGITTKIYTQEDVYNVIRVFQESILNCIENCSEDDLVCIVLEKDPYVSETGSGMILLKNGFHLHFPKIFLERVAQKVYIIPYVVNALKGTPMEDKIDENSINVHWLLYGSAKPGNEPYLVTDCVNYNLESVSFEEEFSDYNVCFPNVCSTFEDKVPQILSIILGNRVNYYRETKPSVVTPLFDRFVSVCTERKQFVQTSIEEQITEAEELCLMIDPKRADDRTDWLTIGFCLHNISGGDGAGFTCWLSFSEMSPKYSESECFSLWDSMRQNNYTIGTLKHFAKLDNPERYNNWVKTKSEYLVDRIIKTSHHDVAKLLFSEYGSEFVCASITDKAWFQFINHTWKPVEKGTTLRQRISSDNGVLMKLLFQKLETSDDRDVIKMIERTIKGLKSAPTKNNIMVECAEVFYNKDFMQLLNSDPYLFAFKNGIYDFSLNKFRPGNPEDYISKQISIDYVDYKTFNHPCVLKIDGFFRNIFPNPSIRTYFLRQVSKVFIGGNADKICLFWTGAGNNGKTVTQVFFEKLLGTYAVKLNTSVITGKKVQNGAANPEMARLGDGTRWAVMEEPNADETINTGIFKNLTGNDTFFARDLYCSGRATREIKPFFKLHFICNKLPNLSNADIATWNRIRVIPFETTFKHVSECPADENDRLREKIYPADLQFEEKIPALLPALAWYLIELWRRGRHLDEPSPPPEVLRATHAYKQETDIFTQFIQDMIVNDTCCKISFSQLSVTFRHWLKMEYPTTVVTQRSMKQEFITILGPLHDDKFWLQKRLKPLEMGN